MRLEKIRDKIVDSIDIFIQKHDFLRKLLIKTRIRDTREKFSKLRTIFINHERPGEHSGEEPLKYSDNRIVTSKYTLLNFIPKNLFEQFRRIANFYFLLNILILFFIPDPPTNPYASVVPLAIVISVTALKQAYEDVLRHKSDWEINSRRVKVIKNGKFQSIKSQDIKCGDIVEVKLDEEFPCDLALLYSMSDTNTCYIKTANLDGETNLKLRSVPFKFPHLNGLDDLTDLKGTLIIEKPNRRLYEFKGKLVHEKKEYLISNENILLRGTSLKIVPAIYGCAIYTGQDSKMMLNSKFKSNKLSCVEKRLNYFVIVYIIILLALSLLCLIGSILHDHVYTTHWYITDSAPDNFKNNKSLYDFIVFMYFTNLNYIIPLSLYVTMELIRFVGSNFFEWDIKMYDEKTDQPAKVNTTDLNEDLGQIEYLFSDKTGTLTENEMLFKHFCINGNIYEEKYGEIFSLTSQTIKPVTDAKIFGFIEALTVCHTVQVDKISSEKYNASSPDELSFIKFCLNLGIVYEGDVFDKNRNVFDRTVSYNIKNESFEKNYEILYILEFDSVRKRMSIIVKNKESNQYFLYCKGADISIAPRCTCKTFSLYEDSLKEFSEKGWRTLVIAYKPLSESEYSSYCQMIDQANSDILNKEEKLNECYDLIESNLKILGVTSVEDRLQEDVEGTLFALRQAGIKIWILTGDKLETAVNISDSCKHFSKEMFKFVLKNLKNTTEVEENFAIINEQMKSSAKQSYALVIDGISLETITLNKKQNDFRSLAVKCDAVLCCRMSPSQKANIVSLIKNSKERPMTAAIGDGANDVSMIQEAHVGIGIFGKEGRNAARSSDFCFAKFKYLKRALLIHGYMYYTRAAVLVLYFFYKNFVFSVCQTYYGFWNAFSSTSVYSSLYISVFNLLLTSVPPFIIALFEQQKNAKELEQTPFFYRSIRKNRPLSAIQFLKWNILAVWHSLVCFFIPLGIFQINSVLLQDGKNVGNYEFGSLVLINIFVIIHFKIFLIWRYQNIFALFSYLMSILGFVFTCLLLNAFIMPFPLTLFTEEQALYFGIFMLFSSGSIWFTIILSLIVAILPDLVLIIVENLSEKVKVDKFIKKENLIEDLRAKSPNTTVENFSLYSIGMERSTASFESSNDLSSNYMIKRTSTLNSNRLFNGNTRRISPIDTLSQSVI